MIWCVTLNPSLDVTFVVPEPWHPGMVGRATAMDVRLGGKGHNVARTVHALGGPVRAVTVLGGGIGRDLAARAQVLGLPLLAEWVAEESRCCVTVVAPDATTELRAAGPPVSPAVLQRLRDRLRAECGPEDWVALSGSLPPGADPGTYADWVEALRPRVRGILVDTSGAALVESLKAGPTAICPNAEEWAAVADHAVPAGTHVLLTLGRDGVRWLPPGGPVRQWRPPTVTVVNPVGAGDSFLGALIWRLHQGDDWAGAVRWGVAVSAASVETVGVALFDRTRAEALWTALPEEGEPEPHERDEGGDRA
ncbi:MAG: PfkB family carbohydrate kinase [Firmicutes bacterium]|nr:PfkB family carbohydrate kinase [Bacillota bacterium]